MKLQLLIAKCFVLRLFYQAIEYVSYLFIVLPLHLSTTTLHVNFRYTQLPIFVQSLLFCRLAASNIHSIKISNKYTLWWVNAFYVVSNPLGLPFCLCATTTSKHYFMGLFNKTFFIFWQPNNVDNSEHTI